MWMPEICWCINSLVTHMFETKTACSEVLPMFRPTQLLTTTLLAMQKSTLMRIHLYYVWICTMDLYVLFERLPAERSNLCIEKDLTTKLYSTRTNLLLNYVWLSFWDLTKSFFDFLDIDFGQVQLEILCVVQDAPAPLRANLSWAWAGMEEGCVIPSHSISVCAKKSFQIIKKTFHQEV